MNPIGVQLDDDILEDTCAFVVALLLVQVVLAAGAGDLGDQLGAPVM